MIDVLDFFSPDIRIDLFFRKHPAGISSQKTISAKIFNLSTLNATGLAPVKKILGTHYAYVQYFYKYGTAQLTCFEKISRYPPGAIPIKRLK